MPTAPKFLSHSEFVDLPNGRYHLRRWGPEGAPLLLMLHGWMDVSLTFEFLVQALKSPWQFVAPDWLGYGQSEWRDRPYWWADYLVDLDALVDHLSPSAPVTVLGHSMGGNIASLWAGIKPHRIKRLIMLESFGHPPGDVSDTTRQFPLDIYTRWVQEGRQRPRQIRHADRAAFVQRLQQANPRLTRERAERLTDGLGLALPDGSWTTAADPWHRSVFNHMIHHHEHFLGAWARIDSPVLWITGCQSQSLARFQRAFGGEEGLNDRMHHLRHLRTARLPDAGHNIHHDQPEAVAALVDAFLAEEGNVLASV